MSKIAVVAVIAIAVLAACAKKNDVTYVDTPVSQEPVFTGKYGS
ncbi:MAG: hypothetical protein WAT77_03630 [Paracoccaceae bacterium]|jgi:type IV pilus biogenesis protein CpaD/CtpE